MKSHNIQHVDPKSAEETFAEGGNTVKRQRQNIFSGKNTTHMLIINIHCIYILYIPYKKIKIWHITILLFIATILFLIEFFSVCAY